MLLDELSELPFDRDDDERIEINDAEEDVVSCLQRVHCLENISILQAGWLTLKEEKLGRDGTLQNQLSPMDTPLRSSSSYT